MFVVGFNVGRMGHGLIADGRQTHVGDAKCLRCGWGVNFVGHLGVLVVNNEIGLIGLGLNNA